MAGTLGFIGVGRLGLPIAENLMAGGFSLRVYNRTSEKAAGLIAKGATVAMSPVATVSSSITSAQGPGAASPTPVQISPVVIPTTTNAANVRRRVMPTPSAA